MRVKLLKSKIMERCARGQNSQAGMSLCCEITKDFRSLRTELIFCGSYFQQFYIQEKRIHILPQSVDITLETTNYYMASYSKM